MVKFTFTAQGTKFSFEATNKLEAYGVANKHFGPLPQGVWMETNTANTEFKWALGNFFD